MQSCGAVQDSSFPLKYCTGLHGPVDDSVSFPCIDPVEVQVEADG